MRLAAELRPDPLGELYRSPRFPSRYKLEVRERRGRKRLVIGRGKRRVARDVNGKGGIGTGREGRKKGGRARLGYLSRGSQVPTYATVQMPDF